MKILVAFVVMISCTVVANLLMKIGASAQDAGPDLVSKVISLPTLLGVACFAISVVVYIQILSWLPLNIAQSFAATQFIAVILASRIFLGEPVSTMQCLGIAFISLGIWVVGWSR